MGALCGLGDTLAILLVGGTISLLGIALAQPVQVNVAWRRLPRHN
jgi:hypothetical protein